MNPIQTSKLAILLLCLLFYSNLYSQQSLHFTPQEIQIWRQRAGIISGEKLYNTYGDANPGSPGDWKRIISTANEFRKNPAVDRYSNYYKGNSCYPTEQKNGWTWRAIDAFQPKQKSDYLVNAAFVYLLNNDESYAKPVHDEIMAYTRIRNLDASNRNIFCTDTKNNVDDFNNFFLAVWYSKILFAYDCTKSSSVWSSKEKARVREWLLAAANYYKEIENNDFSKMIPGRERGDYSTIANYLNEVGWNGPGTSDGKRTHQNGPEVYNLSRKYNNRRTNMVKFYFSVGVYFDDNALITNGTRFYKEYMAYGMLTASCMQADMYRGGGNSPEVGYNYSWICISDMVEMADFYARKFDTSLFDYELGEKDFNKFFSGHNNKGWYRDLAVRGKSLEKAIDNHFKYIDGTYKNSRKFGGEPIDGKTVVYDRYRNANNAFWMYHTWMGRANIYYQNEDWKSIYTGRKANTAYPVAPDIAHGPGIYWNNPWTGVLHNYPGFLFMWGQMEGKVWPYSARQARQEVSKVLDIPSDIDFGQVEINQIVSNEITIRNFGNTVLNISKIESDNKEFEINYSGKIEPYGSAKVIAFYKPIKIGDAQANFKIISDKTDGNDIIKVSAESVKEIVYVDTEFIEAESEGFKVIADKGTLGKIEKANEPSTMLSNNGAIKLFDKGDKVGYDFEVSTDAEYIIKVRLRSGHSTNSTAYWPNGYVFSLNNETLPLKGDINSISSKDDAFGTSFWGTMSSGSISLNRGSHLVEIEANLNWGLIDYIEVLRIQSEEELIETKVLSTTTDVIFDEVSVGESLMKYITIENIGNSLLTIEKLVSSNEVFSCDFTGTVEAGKKRSIPINFSPQKPGLNTGTLEIISDKTEGTNLIDIQGNAKSQKRYFNSKIEAEKSYIVANDNGSKGKVEASTESSALISDKALNLFDIGDAFQIPLNVPVDGLYTIKVRLRIGDRLNSLAYDNTGYRFRVNGESVEFMLDENSVSDQDESYGIAYWGTKVASSIFLTQGENMLFVEALRNWAAVDYIEIIGQEEIKPILEVVSEVNFGDVEIGTAIKESIVLKNTGTDVLRDISLSIARPYAVSWKGEILPGSEQEVNILFEPTSETDYSSELLITAENVEPKKVNIAGVGIKAKPISLYLEAEEHYQSLNDFGNNGRVTVTGEVANVLSSNQAVQLYDKKDAMSISFEISKASNYEIRVRLRAGHRYNPTTYIPNGYQFELENDKLDFGLIEGTLSELKDEFGGSTWGTVSLGALILEPKTYQLKIEALYAWGLIDYIEVVEIENTSKRYIDLNTTAELVEETLEVVSEVNIYPNPATDFININLKNNNSPFRVSLYDTFGNIAYNKEYSMHARNFSIKASSLPRGSYLLTINLNGTIVSQRILVD